MKKSLLLLLCAGILTGCGNEALPAKPAETTTVSQMTTAAQAAEHETTTMTTAGIPEVTETCSEVIPAVTTGTETATTEAIMNTTESTTTTASVQKEKSPAVQSTTTTTTAEPVATSKATTTTKAVVATKPTTTTAKQTTITTTTTTTVVTTTTTQPPAPQSVVDMNRVSDQMWLFLTEYGIAYDELYATGAGLHHDGTDYGKAKAVCEYACNLGGQNCIEYALNAYFLAKGAGLECYIARSSLYDWYGHVGNVVRLDGKWYYMEPQGNIVGSPQTYAAGAAYPDGLDIVTDIYENNISVTIADDWYK